MAKPAEMAYLACVYVVAWNFNGKFPEHRMMEFEWQVSAIVARDIDFLNKESIARIL